MKKYENKDYPLSDLTEKIIKVAFDVFNEFGYGLPERIYQRAFAVELEKSNIEFKKERYGAIKYEGKVIGKYFLDFLVDGQVAVELKIRNELYQAHISQLLNYIKAENLPVGLLLAYSKDGVKVKRLANTISDNLRNKSA